MKTDLAYIRRYERRCISTGEAFTIFVANLLSGLFFLCGAWALWRAGNSIVAIAMAPTAGDLIAALVLLAYSAGFFLVAAACQLISQTIKSRAAIRAALMIAEDAAVASSAKRAFPVSTPTLE